MLPIGISSLIRVRRYVSAGYGVTLSQEERFDLKQAGARR